MGFPHALMLFLTLSLAADPSVGTWKLNVAKSKFGSGPVYKNILVKIETQGDRIQYTIDTVPARGEALHYTFRIGYNGTDYPVTGYPTADTVAATRIDDNTVDLVFKKGGREVVRRHEIISNGGKTRTVTTRTRDLTGRYIESTTVFDKQ